MDKKNVFAITLSVLGLIIGVMDWIGFKPWTGYRIRLERTSDKPEPRSEPRPESSGPKSGPELSRPEWRPEHHALSEAAHGRFQMKLSGP